MVVGWSAGRTFVILATKGDGEILDLFHFNQALLGKWWWKFVTDPT